MPTMRQRLQDFLGKWRPQQPNSKVTYEPGYGQQVELINHEPDAAPLRLQHEPATPSGLELAWDPTRNVELMPPVEVPWHDDAVETEDLPWGDDRAPTQVAPLRRAPTPVTDDLPKASPPPPATPPGDGLPPKAHDDLPEPELLGDIPEEVADRFFNPGAIVRAPEGAQATASGRRRFDRATGTHKSIGLKKPFKVGPGETASVLGADRERNLLTLLITTTVPMDQFKKLTPNPGELGDNAPAFNTGDKVKPLQDVASDDGESTIPKTTTAHVKLVHPDQGTMEIQFPMEFNMDDWDDTTERRERIVGGLSKAAARRSVTYTRTAPARMGPAKAPSGGGRMRRAPGRGRGKGRDERRRRVFVEEWYLRKGGTIAYRPDYDVKDSDDYEFVQLKPDAKVLELSEDVLSKYASLNPELDALIAAVQTQATSIDRLTKLVEQLMARGNNGGYDAIKTEDRLIVLDPKALKKGDAPKRRRWMQAANEPAVATAMWHGLPLAFEYLAGDLRGERGSEYASYVPYHYGYIPDTLGNDGDALDVLVGEDPDAEQVYLGVQSDPDTGAFAQFKLLLNFDDAALAEGAMRIMWPDHMVAGVHAVPLKEFLDVVLPKIDLAKQAWVAGALEVGAWLLENWQLVAAAYPTLKDLWTKFQNNQATMADAEQAIESIGLPIVESFMAGGGVTARTAAGVVDLQGLDRALTDILTSDEPMLRGKVGDYVTTPVLSDPAADARFKDVGLMTTFNGDNAFGLAPDGSYQWIQFALNKLINDDLPAGRRYNKALSTVTHELRHAADWAYNPKQPAFSKSTRDKSITDRDDRNRQYLNNPTELKSWAGNVADGLWQAYGSQAMQLSGDQFMSAIKEFFPTILEYLDEANRVPFLQRVHKALEQRVQPQPRQAARVLFEDELAEQGELDQAAVVVGDRVRLPDSSLGTVQQSDPNAGVFQVETLVTVGGDTRKRLITIDSDDVTLKVDSRDPRLTDYRIDS